MIWYKDKDLIIEFDKVPNIKIFYPLPNLSQEEKKEIIKKPFLNEYDINVTIKYKENYYSFLVPQNYTWDGATIPRIFWRLIGPNTSPEFLIPSMIHDILCQNHCYINNNRYLSTIILERLLFCSGCTGWKRWLIKHSVDNFQKFNGWSK